MSHQTWKMSLGVFAAVALVLGASGIAQADTIIAADTFTLNGGTRVTGTDLNGLAVETVTGTWARRSDDAGVFVLTSDGKVQDSNTNTIHGIASVGFTPVAGNTYAVEALITPSITSDWVGIGFSQGTNTFQSSSGWAWVLCKGSGEVQGFGGSSTNNKVLQDSVIVGSGRTFRVELEYHPVGTSKMRVLVDGAERLAWTNLANSIPVGGITSAGFKWQNGNTDARVDNFQLTLVPEPATMALLGLGGLTLLARRRRKS